MRNVAKRLKFPLLGVAKNLSYQDTTYPTEGREYATPMAVNVIGSCVFEGRTRGGSRPGLAAVPQGTQVTEAHPTDIIYRDRKIVFDGSVWMASAIGNHEDFDFGKDSGDSSRAVAGNVALAGKSGEAITAAIPVGDSVLFLATLRAIRMVQGEPTAAVSPVSDNVGVISRYAWCFDGQRVWFMGANGLYGMVPGESPILASSQLPDDFKGWSAATLVYDAENLGIHIFGQSDYFYDIEAKAVWPIQYNAAVRPTAGGAAVVNGVNKAAFRVGNEWYFWDETAAKDAGLYDIASKVMIGPFRCGVRDDGDGMLDSLTVTLGKYSAPQIISISTSHSAEGSYSDATPDTGDWRGYTILPGFNNVFRPRKRGAWCVIVILGTGRWAYESILANIKTLGRLRP